MSDSPEPLYVYGVMSIAERDSLSVAGVEGSDVGTVEYDGLAALTSPVQGESLRVAREIRAHLRVLQEASEGATVLPVRFGTVLENERAVRERLLEPNAEHLDALLKRLSGCIQLTVKATYDEERLLRDVVSASPALTALTQRVRNMPEAAAYYERIRLGEAIAAAVAARRDADTARALTLMEPAALATHGEELAAPYEAFNLSFLVKRTQEEEFGRCVQTVFEELGERMEIRYVGPLPPYSFAEGELEAA